VTTRVPPVLHARTSDADATRAVAAAVAGLVRAGDIIVLAGDLGAGKTVFVQGFARALGVTEPVTSPTFTLVRPYPGTALEVLHADLYRLENLSEVVDLGLLEQLDGRSVACIEWGDLAEPALPPDFLEVRIVHRGEENDRHLAFRAVGAGWLRRLDALAVALERWACDPADGP